MGRGSAQVAAQPDSAARLTLFRDSIGNTRALPGTKVSPLNGPFRSEAAPTIRATGSIATSLQLGSTDAYDWSAVRAAGDPNAGQLAVGARAGRGVGPDKRLPRIQNMRSLTFLPHGRLSSWLQRSPLGSFVGATLSLTVSIPLAQAAPPEVLAELALHPADPDRMVLSYRGGGQGLLFSQDGGQSFQLRCGAAISDAFTQRRAPLHVTSDGVALLGTFQGLVRGGSNGCGFELDSSLSGLQVADFASHPGDPMVTFAATANSASGQPTGLVRLGAGGLLELPAEEEGTAQPSITRLRAVARPNGPPRVYASAIAPVGNGDYYPLIQYTDDLGSTWIRHEVEGAGDARVVLVAADPTDADTIAIALLRDAAPDLLWVSQDAGRTFEPRLELTALGASSVAPDGRLWLGDSGGDTEYSAPGGLYVLDDFLSPARQLTPLRVQCLGYRALDGALFACTRHEFGRVETATGQFSVLSSLRQITGFVECGEEQLAPLCQPQLCNNWCGVLHYADAPLCDAYDEVDPLCGPAARAYGQPATPEPEPAAPAVSKPTPAPLEPAPGLPALETTASIDTPPTSPDSNSVAGSSGCATRPLQRAPEALPRPVAFWLGALGLCVLRRRRTSLRR